MENNANKIQLQLVAKYISPHPEKKTMQRWYFCVQVCVVVDSGSSEQCTFPILTVT